MVVVITQESNIASYFPEAGNLNGSNVGMCFDVAEPSNSGSGDFLSFWIDHGSRTFTISPTTSATDRHLVFERDYIYHTSFRGVLRHHA